MVTTLNSRERRNARRASEQKARIADLGLYPTSDTFQDSYNYGVYRSYSLDVGYQGYLVNGNHGVTKRPPNLPSRNSHAKGYGLKVWKMSK